MKRPIGIFRNQIHDLAYKPEQDKFDHAFASLQEDVALWQAETGVLFTLEVSTGNDHFLGKITIIQMVFDNEADLAFYNMHIPNHKVATNLAFISDVSGCSKQQGWYFNGWKSIESISIKSIDHADFADCPALAEH